MESYEDHVREVLARIKDTPDFDILLDDLVHDAKSTEASTINNGGPEAQLYYLLSIDGAINIIDYFESMKEEA